MENPLEPDLEFDFNNSQNSIHQHQNELQHAIDSSWHLQKKLQQDNKTLQSNPHKGNPQIQAQKEDVSLADLGNQLSFLDTSAPNINYPQKYQQNLQLISSLRTQLRSMKEEIHWTKLSKEGYQQENQTLKELLLEKKSIICKLNNDLSKANQEIGRLQDAIQGKNTQITQMQNSSETLLTSQKMLKSKIKQLNRQLKLKQDSLNQIQQTYRLEKINMEERLRKQQITTFQKGKKALEAILNQNFSSIESLYSPTQYAGQNDQQLTGGNIQQVMLAKLRQLKEINSLNQGTIKQLKLQLTQQKQSNLSLQKCNKIREEQLQEATCLLQEQKDHLLKKKTQIIEARTAIAEIKSYSKQVRTKLQKDSAQQLRSVLLMILPLLPEEVAACFPDLSSFPEDCSLLENILQREIGIYSKNKTVLRQTQQVSLLMKHQLSELEEEYDVLSLKYQTLRREYEAVTDDNRRLLKLNSLSRHRTERNQHKDQTNTKQNKLNSINGTPNNQKSQHHTLANTNRWNLKPQI